MAVKKFGDLEIESSAVKKVHTSKTKMLLQLCLLALIILGLLGLTGGGGLAKTHFSSPDGAVQINYARIGRIQISQNLDFILTQPNFNGQYEIAFDQKYLQNMFVKQILPTPTQTKIVNDRIVYTFDVVPAHKPIIVSFQLEPQTRGFMWADFIVDQKKFLLHQFIYP